MLGFSMGLFEGFVVGKIVCGEVGFSLGCQLGGNVGILLGAYITR